MVQESEGGMRQGLYISVDVVKEIVNIIGCYDWERFERLMKEAADIYVTENGHILRKAE